MKPLDLDRYPSQEPLPDEFHARRRAAEIAWRAQSNVPACRDHKLKTAAALRVQDLAEHNAFPAGRWTQRHD